MLSLVGRVSVALNRTADHTDVLTTYAEVNIRVKKNSDNPASTQVVANLNFAHQQTYSVLHSPRPSYSIYFNVRVCDDE